MIKEQWIYYAILTIKAIKNGSGSIRTIAEDVKIASSAPISETYIAKVVADLRNARIIDQNYELLRKPDNILISELITASGLKTPLNHISASINNLVLTALNEPITKVW